MLNRMEGKVIAIAGGCGVIGSGVSRRLAQEGARVVIGDLNAEAAEALASEINRNGGSATPVGLDITSEASIAAFVETAVKAHGGLDGFYANALMQSRGRDDDVLTVDLADYDQLVNVNMRGYFLCTRAALPALVARGGGCMLYTSSGAAHAGTATLPVYSMSKSAVHALMRHVASRYGPKGVRSNVIAPGHIHDPALSMPLAPETIASMADLTKVKLTGAPSDIAAMATLLLSDEGRFVTGQVISVDGGVTMRP